LGGAGRLKSAGQLAVLAEGVRERRRNAARFARLGGASLRDGFYVMAEAMTRKATATATQLQRKIRPLRQRRAHRPLQVVGWCAWLAFGQSRCEKGLSFGEAVSRHPSWVTASRTA
jgi:hypothetical protein